MPLGQAEESCMSSAALSTNILQLSKGAGAFAVLILNTVNDFLARERATHASQGAKTAGR